MGSPYIDFVASKTVGAFTFATGQQQFIAIHAGIIKMFWTFNVLLSHPMVLRRVGNPHLEVAHQPVDLLIRNIENNPHSTVRKPIDPIRAEFANQLSMICFHFLVAHEVGHLLHGHLEFLEANRTADNLTRHALELDADHFAVNAAINEVLRLFRQKSDLPAVVSEVYFDECKSLFVALFSLNVLYRLQWLHDTTFWDFERPERSHTSHSPVPIRTLGLLACAGARVEHDPKLVALRSRIRRISTMATIHAEVGLQRIRGMPAVVPDGFGATGAPQTMEYVNRLNGRWAELRPCLQRFSHLPLPNFPDSTAGDP